MTMNKPDTWNPRPIRPHDLPQPLRAAAMRSADGATPAAARSAPPSAANSSVSSPICPDCPDCQDTGWYLLAVPYGHPEFGQLQRCPCGQADAAIRAQRHARAAAQLGDELADKAACTFASFDLGRPLAALSWRGVTFTVETQRRFLRAALEACLEYIQGWQGWVYLHGSYGAGKSHLAAAIAHAALESGRTVLYRSVPGLMDAVRASKGDDLLDEVLAADVVVLDDIGSEQLAGWIEEKLFRLLNERLAKPLILTSNLAPADLPPRLESRIYRARSRTLWMPISDYYPPMEEHAR